MSQSERKDIDPEKRSDNPSKQNLLWDGIGNWEEIIDDISVIENAFPLWVLSKHSAVKERNLYIIIYTLWKLHVVTYPHWISFLFSVFTKLSKEKGPSITNFFSYPLQLEPFVMKDPLKPNRLIASLNVDVEEENCFFFQED